MAGLSANQQAFFKAFVTNSGINPGVAKAWMAAEEPVGASAGYHGTQDWLNVGITDSGPLGSTNSIWQNPTAAGAATAKWMKGQWDDPGFGRAAPGIQAITQAKTPQAQIEAIQHSGWASSGYPSLPALYQQYSGTPMPKGGVTIPRQPNNMSAPQAASTGAVTNQGIPNTRAIKIPGSTQVNWADAGAQAFMKAAENNHITVGSQASTGASLAAQIKPTQLSTNTSTAIRQNTVRIPGQIKLVKGQIVMPTAQKPVTLPGQPQQNNRVSLRPGGGYVDPLPGATIGRSDQGVDATLNTGQPIVALGKSRVVGIEPNWYAGQPYVWMQLLDGPHAGQYWYAAEQISPSVHAGQVVQAGQPIGHYAPSGTGLELGWATKSGATLARTTSGYTEGEATPAGKAFTKLVGKLAKR